MGRIKQKRVFGYDLIKAFAMFLIVLYHFNSVDFDQVPDDGWYIPNVTKFFYALCSAGVPLFFMVNGALLGSKLMTFRKCLEKSARLLFVAVLWTALFICILSPFIQGRGFPSVGEFKNYYWFLYTLSALYWINYILNKSKWLKMIVVAFLLVFPFLTNLVWDVIIAYNPNASIPNWGHTGVFTLYSVVYYYLGAFLSKKNLPIWLSLLSIIMGLLLVNGEVLVMSTHNHQVYDGVNACFPTVGAMMISIGVFTLLKKVRLNNMPKLRQALSLIGCSTIGIYVLHLFILLLVREHVFNNEIQHPLVVVACALAVVIFTTVITQIIMRSRMKWLLKL